MTSEAFVTTLIKSIQKSPQMTALIIIVSFLTLSASFLVFAEKSKFEQHVEKADKHFLSLEQSIRDLRFTVSTDPKHTEIFELERIIDSGDSRDVDHKRLSKLKKELRYAEIEYARTKK